MRYTLSSGQLILVCSVIFLVSKFIDCHEICSKPEFEDYKKVIFENNSYEYSHHYYYSRVIRHNQPLPVLSDNFEKVSINQIVVPEFVIKFYGTDVTSLSIDKSGSIFLYKGSAIGLIDNVFTRTSEHVFQISNGKELLAIRQSYHKRSSNGDLTFKVTTMISSNGKISFYYENVPKTTVRKYVRSGFIGEFQCGEEGDEKETELSVHRKWIRSGTLVEYEALGDCPKYNSSEACQDAKTSNTTCIWCEKANVCTSSNDKDVHKFKVNGCQGKNVTTGRRESLSIVPTNSLSLVFIILILLLSCFCLLQALCIFYILIKWKLFHGMK
ncbi:unnamed protein product [Schistosoma haematobium]|nr:unnamed protein product [Schistosoma haematobium]